MRLAALLLLFAVLPAAARPLAPLADVQVYDRTAGRYLDVIEHDGRRYVEGVPGHEFRIELRSLDGSRLLAVTSVDGVNVVSGQTASTDQGGYVLAPWTHASIDGWRKSLQDVAAFYFTEHRNSYAARTGRPHDVGVIGVALFREKPVQRCCWPWLGDSQAELERPEDRAAAGAAAESAPAPSAAEPQLKSQRRDSRLGTGHGRRLDSEVTTTAFERASESPDQVIAIYYDSRANLVAQGVLPRTPHVARHEPRPFPGSFVPDP